MSAFTPNAHGTATAASRDWRPHPDLESDAAAPAIAPRWWSQCAGRVGPRSTVYIGEDTFLGARVGEYDRFRGRWVVYTFPQNTAAQVFWRTIVERYTGGQFVSDRWEGYGGLGYTWCFYSDALGRESRRER